MEHFWGKNDFVNFSWQFLRSFGRDAIFYSWKSEIFMMSLAVQRDLTKSTLSTLLHCYRQCVKTETTLLAVDNWCKLTLSTYTETQLQSFSLKLHYRQSIIENYIIDAFLDYIIDNFNVSKCEKVKFSRHLFNINFHQKILKIAQISLPSP